MYKDNFLLVKTKTSFKSTYQNFHVVLVGFQTEAKLNSDWNSPSFYTKTMVRVSSQFERAGDLLVFFKYCCCSCASLRVLEQLGRRVFY